MPLLTGLLLPSNSSLSTGAVAMFENSGHEQYNVRWVSSHLKGISEGRRLSLLVGADSDRGGRVHLLPLGKIGKRADDVDRCVAGQLLDVGHESRFLRSRRRQLLARVGCAQASSPAVRSRVEDRSEDEDAAVEDDNAGVVDGGERVKVVFENERERAEDAAKEVHLSGNVPGGIRPPVIQKSAYWGDRCR